MIPLSAASSGSAIPDWLAIAGAVAGLVGGIGGAAICVVTVRTAQKTLSETRMTPIRQKLHDLVDRLVDQVAELLSALDTVNRAVQESSDGTETRTAMEQVELVTRQITTQAVADADAELHKRLENLHDTVFGSPGLGLDVTFIDFLHSYAGLQGRLQAARQRVAQQATQVDDLVRLAEERGRDVEPLRRRNEQVIAAAQNLLERLHEIQREGLGEIQGERRRSIRLRFPGHRESLTPPP